ncbi:uncharacterized protein LOC135466288 isoform X2 [Liolophura sinensis]|uniref:uncharacterized protein LOC135466288 isoform X2 n=1 Tax=Liolophura sinensis TaxID=3198878 RepID=UPI0031598A66
MAMILILVTLHHHITTRCLHHLQGGWQSEVTWASKALCEAEGSRGIGVGQRGGMMSGWGFKKHPAEVLDDLCQKNGWGSPVYQLHSAVMEVVPNSSFCTRYYHRFQQNVDKKLV